MTVRIRTMFQCPHECGGEADNGITAVITDADGIDKPIDIELDMIASQDAFVCNVCGCQFFTGDFADMLFDDADGDCEYEDAQADAEGEGDERE